MTTAMILTGSDRYESPWHDHAATAQRIAETLAEIGINGRLRGTRPSAFARLDDVDLLVVDAGGGHAGPTDANDNAWREAHQALDAYLTRGGPLLVVHNGISAFGDFPAWADWVGGQWIPGVSMHPPIAHNRIVISDGDHPITNGLGDIDVYDELYSHLTVTPGNTILASHAYEDRDHPLVWTRERGATRIVYDALGHGVESYDSPDRVCLLKRAALWALGADPADIQRV